MKCIFWNCCSASSTNFKNTMIDLCREHDLELNVILESKAPFVGLESFIGNLGSFQNIIVDPNERGRYLAHLGSQEGDGDLTSGFSTSDPCHCYHK